MNVGKHLYVFFLLLFSNENWRIKSKSISLLLNTPCHSLYNVKLKLRRLRCTAARCRWLKTSTAWGADIIYWAKKQNCVSQQEVRSRFWGIYANGKSPKEERKSGRTWTWSWRGKMKPTGDANFAQRLWSNVSCDQCLLFRPHFWRFIGRRVRWSFRISDIVLISGSLVTRPGQQAICEPLLLRDVWTTVFRASFKKRYPHLVIFCLAQPLIPQCVGGFT